MDNVYQSKSKDSGRDCEHHFQLSFALPFFSTLPFLGVSQRTPKLYDWGLILCSGRISGFGGLVRVLYTAWRGVAGGHDLVLMGGDEIFQHCLFRVSPHGHPNCTIGA